MLACLYLRCLGALLLLPLGERALLFKGALALLFAIALAEIPASSEASSLFVQPLMGMLISLPLFLCAQAAQMMGELYDNLRGQTLAVAYGGPQQYSLHALSARWVVVAELGLLGGFELWGQSLARSVAVLEVDWAQLAALLFHQTVDQLAQVFFLLLPFAGLALCVDLGLGLLSKLLPRLEVFPLSFQLKSLLGYLLLALILRGGWEGFTFQFVDFRAL